MPRPSAPPGTRPTRGTCSPIGPSVAMPLLTAAKRSTAVRSAAVSASRCVAATATRGRTVTRPASIPSTHMMLTNRCLTTRPPETERRHTRDMSSDGA